MRLKNLAAVISFLIAAVSCSMEDDVLNKLAKDPDNGTQAEVYYSVNASRVVTKAGGDYSEAGEDEAGIFTSCDILLCEGDGIVGVYNDVAPAYVSGKKFLVKVGRTYEVLVIADAAQDFSKSTSKAAILSTALSAADMNKSVKFGRSEEFTATTDNGSATVGDAPEIKTVDVELNQLTAKVHLKAINVTFAEGVTPSKVTLENVQLLNQKTSATITDPNSGTTLTTQTTTLNKDLAVGENANLAEFNTFPNTDASNPAALAFTAAVEGKWNKVAKQYIINRPDAADFNNDTDHEYIKAGYIYELTVNATVTAETVECELIFNVLPWDLMEEEISYVDIPTIAEGRFLTWENFGTDASIDKSSATLFINNPAQTFTATFRLDDPKGATWYASLIPVEGDINAFGFEEGFSSGTIAEGKDAVIKINSNHISPRQTNKAKLEIVVKTPDGNTMIANVLKSGEYGNTKMTIVQNKQ